MAHPACEREIDRDALASYFRFGYFSSSHSVLRGVRQLMPGTALEIPSEGQTAGEPIAHTYWSALDVAARGPRLPKGQDLTEEFEHLLQDAVRRRMIADVPLGAFLSGGVDSSTVVALMQKQSSKPVKTFTIGFHEDGYSEAEHAKAVACHLGTDHTELFVTSKQAMQVIPSLPSLYDEPFADSSQIPTFLLSRLARQHVTVSLSGDGGDELFGGYNRYRITESLWKKLSIIPKPMR